MSILRIQAILVWIYFIIYFYTNYTIDDALGFTLDYLISVLSLTALTVAIPWFATKALVCRVSGSLKWVVRIFMPTIVSALGFVGYTYKYTAAQNQNFELQGIIGHSLPIGITLSILTVATALIMAKQDQKVII